MNRKDYSAGAVKHSFWFMEFRKVVSLRSEGKTWEEIKQLNEEENIFGAPTVLRATQIFNTVSARVKSLDDSFYPIFESCDLASQKLLALVAAMTYDVLFGELVYELVREKMIIGSNELADSDLRIFFKDKQQQSDKAATWTEATIKTNPPEAVDTHGILVLFTAILDPVLFCDGEEQKYLLGLPNKITLRYLQSRII